MVIIISFPQSEWFTKVCSKLGKYVEKICEEIIQQKFQRNTIKYRIAQASSKKEGKRLIA